ncbi:plasmid partitioning protein ParB [Synechococcus sp. KORDI-100]|uniref:ParB-like protein n=1 Tax=Synechococcus sp. KORDI-100 TaxID=1280380 RepID=UPI0004E02E80|nr:plasmid partitioning protein ParB [Synechococcus sp. KORDI-100]
MGSMAPGVSLSLPPYQRIPEAGKDTELIEVSIAELQPTQWCIGLAEVWARQEDFSKDSREERLDYLKGKPVPLVRSAAGKLWMVDRHHRLRGLHGLDAHASAWGYVIADLPFSERDDVLRFLQQQGWLYLYDGRGQGPRASEELPTSLMDLDDDPYRSLVWKLKKEGAIKPQAQIPYHEFRWGAWLRRRPLPPFSSRQLEPALPAARRLVCSPSASSLAGWRGDKRSCR